MNALLAFVVTLAVGLVPFGTAHAQPAPTMKPPVELNPELVAACGLQVILVLDESGSIQSTPGAEAAVRQASSAFINALADTGSDVAIVEFGTKAKTVMDYTPITSGTGGTIATEIDPYIFATASGDVYDPPSQLGSSTNWDDALDEVESINVLSSVAPLVVFITDGDPTAYNLDYDGESGAVTPGTADQRLWRAMEEANAVKAQGSKILVVGVGNGLNNPDSQERLEDVSGPEVAPPATFDIQTNDVLLITEFSNLEAALREVAFQLCAPTVTVTKKVDLVEAEGWVFSGSVDSPISGGTAYGWVSPDDTAGPGDMVSDTTGVDGTVTFQWEPDTPVNSEFFFSEELQTDHVFTDALCTRKTLTATGIVEDTFDPGDVANGTSIVVGPSDIITCEVNNEFIPNPSLMLDKSSTTAHYAAVNDAISYAYDVTNTGNIRLTDPVSVNDDKTTVTCPSVSTVGNADSNLDPGEKIVCSATYNVTQADLDAGSVINTAHASAEGVTSNPDSVTVPATVNASLLLDKSPTVANYAAAGEVIGYLYQVTNNGNVTVSTISVSDSLGIAVNCPVSTLAPTASTTCTASYPVTQADLDAGQVDNTATAAGVDPQGDGVNSNPDSVTVPAVVNAALLLDKSAITADYAAPGDVINYEFLITNNGNVTVSTISVIDTLGITVNCPATTLAPAASTTCTASYPVTQTDLDAGQVDNSATAAGVDQQGNAVTSNPDNVTVPAAVNASLLLDKSTTAANTVALGELINYEFLITNDGNMTVSMISVTDSLSIAVNCPATTLAPAASTTCTASYTVAPDDMDAGQVENTATAAGTDPQGNAVISNPDTVIIDVEQIPGVPEPYEDGPASPLVNTTDLSDAERAAYALLESIILVTKAKIHASSCGSTAGEYSMSVFTNGLLEGEIGEDNHATVTSLGGSYGLDAAMEAKVNFRGQKLTISQDPATGTFSGRGVSGFSATGFYNEANNMLVMNGKVKVVGNNGRPDQYKGRLIKDFYRGALAGPEFYLIYDWGLEALLKLGYPANKYWQRSKSRRDDGVNGRTVFVQDRLVGATVCRIKIDLNGFNSEDLYWQNGTLTVSTDKPVDPVLNPDGSDAWSF